MKGSKKLDILVYLLFFGILAMFAGLIFSFFKTGHFELVEERKDLAAGVQKITIASDISQVEIRQGEGDAPYIVYDRQVAKDARDNISFEQNGEEVVMTIQRQKSNRVTNWGISSAKVVLYLPKDSRVAVSLQIDLVRLTADTAQMESLQVEGRLMLLAVNECQIDHLDVRGNVASLHLDEVECSDISAALNIGNLRTTGISPEEGVQLTSSVNLGRIDTTLPLETGQWDIVVNDEQIRACGSAKNKLDLEINLANIVLE